jgi:hypothetical protein
MSITLIYPQGFYVTHHPPCTINSKPFMTQWQNEWQLSYQGPTSVTYHVYACISLTHYLCKWVSMVGK